MISIVPLIVEAVDSSCLVTDDLTKGDCTVVLDESSKKSIAVDLDLRKNPIGINKTRCDFLFFADSEQFSYVIPLELSTNPNKNPELALRQLQAGARYAETQIPANAKICFSPSMVTKTLSRHAHLEFRKMASKVKFHKHRQRIKRFSCGVSMSTILEKGRKTQYLK